MLIIMAGLPGTGKSTLARAAAEKLYGGAVIDKDKVRAALFEPADIEYTTEQDDYVMDLMLHTARWLLIRDSSRSIFLTGRTFSRAYQRRDATALQHPSVIVECWCRPETALQRIAEQKDHPAANRNAELYHRISAQFEPIPDAIRIDTDQPLPEATTQLLEALRKEFGRLQLASLKPLS